MPVSMANSIVSLKSEWLQLASRELSSSWPTLPVRCLLSFGIVIRKIGFSDIGVFHPFIAVLRQCLKITNSLLTDDGETRRSLSSLKIANSYGLSSVIGLLVMDDLSIWLIRYVSEDAPFFFLDISSLYLMSKHFRVLKFWAAFWYPHDSTIASVCKAQAFASVFEVKLLDIGEVPWRVICTCQRSPRFLMLAIFHSPIVIPAWHTWFQRVLRDGFASISICIKL